MFRNSKLCQKLKVRMALLLSLVLLGLNILYLTDKNHTVGETKSSPTIPVKASSIPHVGRDGNHQLYYYYIWDKLRKCE